jgi:hypothetical protein
MEKKLYIKTEPGGTVCFGKMSDQDIDLFEKSKVERTLSKDLIYKIKRGLGAFAVFQGVINTGSSGDRGNEGVISISESKVEVPKDLHGRLVDGCYAVFFSLSKVSIEFLLTRPKVEKYDASLLTEESVRIDLPVCVKHGTYDDLRFNVVTNYFYDGLLIKNANKNMTDRGYEESCSIFRVANGDVELLYSFVDSEETFH